MAAVVEEAREKGYVKTMLGRRRMLRDIDSRNAMARQAAERLAINSPVQGTAADLIKLAMIHVQRYLHEEKTKSTLLLQVHDELVFDLHHSERDSLPAALCTIMKNAMPMKVPLEVEYGLGQNWLQAH